MAGSKPNKTDLSRETCHFLHLNVANKSMLTTMWEREKDKEKREKGEGDGREEREEGSTINKLFT